MPIEIFEAEKQYLKAIEANPYSPFINYNIGTFYIKSGRYDIAQIYLDKACKYKKNYSDAYNKLGLIMYHKNNFSSALGYLNKAIEFNNASHENYYYIGSVYNKLGKTDLAISNLEKAISIKKDFLKGIIELGKYLKTLPLLKKLEIYI